MFDAAKLAVPADATYDLQIVDQRGQPTDIVITVSSQDSDAASNMRRKTFDRRIAAMQKRSGKTQVRAEELESEAMDLRCACTVGWVGLAWGDDKNLACTDENKRMVFGKVKLIRDQVDEAISDLSLFMPG